MSAFLERVAQALEIKHGEGLSEFTFVFPNQRAGMFFQKALAGLSSKPRFSPEILSVQECFEDFTGLKSADRIDLLFRLYRHYIVLSGSNESFDSFVYWGELILNDFNEVDKYLVDAKQLFTNIADLKEIDEKFSYLSENQKEVISRFWNSFNWNEPGNSSESFVSTWKILSDLYNNFRNELISDGIAYEGMLTRDSVNNIRKSGTTIPSNYVFVGFNALNPCELELFKNFKKNGDADFYWDYDSVVLKEKEHPAARFMHRNVSEFPSKIELKKHENLLSEKEFRLYQIPSSVGQTKLIHKLLRELNPDPRTASSTGKSLSSGNHLVPGEHQSFGRQDVPEELPVSGELLKTAVVLPDEQLLIPLVHAIPEHIQQVNVTMGYPLQLSTIAGLFDLIYVLHKKTRVSGTKTLFYYRNVLNILNHPMVKIKDADTNREIQERMIRQNLIYIDPSIFSKSDFLELLFRVQKNPVAFIDYLLELIQSFYSSLRQNKDLDRQNKLETTFLYEYYLTVNRLKDIFGKYSDMVPLKLETLTQLIRQLTSGLSVPFVGEPLQGLQIMGVLETRGLDFENLIISSFNEGIYPSKSSNNSFIPYEFRNVFGLPTFEHKDSISAYNFYRLINHAKRVYMISDIRSENGSTGEISRFYYQLKYLHQVDIKQIPVLYDFRVQDERSLTIIKDEHVQQKLNNYVLNGKGSKAFSASSLNTYINCPLQFYFSQLENMQEEDEITELLAHDLFGNIFHSVMENLYKPFVGRFIRKEELESIGSLQIDKEINKAFSIHFYKNKDGSLVELSGNNLLIAKIISKYVNHVLKVDASYTPFTLHSTEENVYATLDTRFGKVNLKGFIDRVDEKEGLIRVLDYKTGKGELDFKSVQSAFDPNEPNRPKYVLQTLLYGLLYKYKHGSESIAPGIFYIKDVFKTDFSTSLLHKISRTEKQVVNNYGEYEDEFREELVTCIENIMDPSLNFNQTEDPKNCVYCQFKEICKR